MDMQMPELDGLAATRVIRASGGPCAAVPIFALTADASAERRRFYDGAGLTDFLTKPIDLKALAERLATIDHSASGANAVRHAAKAPQVVETLEERRIVELRSVLGTVRFEALLTLLVSECRQRPARLRAACRRGDLTALHAEAHNIKGAASSIGAAALGQAASRIEQAPDLASAKPLLKQFNTIAQATMIAASYLISPPPVDRVTA